ncbi:hypothetical protein ABZ079_07420 [Streptomyces sp. NPDC006314]|uniref:hypothetical protein n=1 Tax=Streptomyces sp. NPDC006314 TaxID=3154475 RepID=UPI0033B819D1
MGRVEAGTRHNVIRTEARTALNPRTRSEEVRVAAVHGDVLGWGAVFDRDRRWAARTSRKSALGAIPYSYRFVTPPPGCGMSPPDDTFTEKFSAVPSSHSPHFAPDLSTVVPGVRTLVPGTLSLLSVT